MSNTAEPPLDEQIDSNRPVMFCPRRLTHANIFVGHLERSMAFYGDVCGLEGVGIEPGIRAGFLSNGNSHHDIGLVEVTTKALIGRDGHVQVPMGRGREPGLNHFGWEMENEADLVDAYRRACDAGLKIHRTVDHQIAHSVYVFDPDGNLHEFFADFTKDWRHIMKGGMLELLTGNWTPGTPEPIRVPKYHVDPEIRHVSGSVFHPRRLVHAVIIARNYERMRRFFTDVGGLTVLHEANDRSYVCFGGKAGSWDVTMFRPQMGESQALHHVSFEVESEDELTAAEHELRRRTIGVERSLDLPSKRSVFIRDPDGFGVEFFRARALDYASFASVPASELRYHL